MSDVINISTVTPVYAGAPFLSELIKALESVRSRWESDPSSPFRLIESIFVIDAAIDDSEQVLTAESARYDWVRIVTLSRNFGQHPATIAGILHSSGDWILTLDEDLQHHPDHFLDLLREAVINKSDVVYARPRAAVHESLLRDAGSRLFKHFVSMATNNVHIGHFNSYRLIRGPMARATASVCSHETYFDIALCWFSNRIRSLTLPMKDQRFIATGKSGYSLSGLLSHARRMIVSSRARVLRFTTVLGAFFAMVGVALAAIVVLQKIYHPETVPVQGWASLFVANVFFGGTIVFLLSVIMEYLINIVLHTQGKPTFFVIDRSLDLLAERYFARQEKH